MKILTEQCSTCIFRPGNLMHLEAGRVREMVAECRRVQSHITCHQTLELVTGDRDTEAVCAGFFERYPNVSQLVRIFERLDMIEHVPAPELEGAE